jgi:uncharacterized protein (UPF0276 family)
VTFQPFPSARAGPPVANPVPASAGIGLRFPHHDYVLRHAPAVPWFEVHPENYMRAGAPTEELESIRASYPISLHAVGLSLGSSQPTDSEHLSKLASLVDRFAPGLVSDHLSWSASNGVHVPDLLPLPYTKDVLEIVARNVDIVQNKLRRRIAIENPSRYLEFAASAMSEPEFLAELLARTGCAVLLDVNNVFVTARNLGTNPDLLLGEYLNKLPAERIVEIHLAGHATRELDGGTTVRIDDHGSPVTDEVWTLYDRTIATLGPRPVLIEWDTAIPAFATLLAEAARAQCSIRSAAEKKFAHVRPG